MKYGIKTNPIEEIKFDIKELIKTKSLSKIDNIIIKANYENSNNNNKFLIKIDDITISIDHWNPTADLIFVSHAHMDHIPKLPLKPKIDSNTMKNDQNCPQFICSKITKEIAEVRTDNRFTFSDDKWLLGKDSIYPQSINYQDIKLTLLENGHTFGSTSLLIEGLEKILYTSDFITENREFLNGKGLINGLKPIKCDRLVMECTFGAPQYIFPSFDKLQEKLNQYIKHQISNGLIIILLAYAFGKSQIILNSLNWCENIILDKSIARNTEILEKNGLQFPKWKPYNKFYRKIKNRKDGFIILTTPRLIFKVPYKKLISLGAKVVLFSGNVLNKTFREKFPANLYMPLSDHCDFKSLCRFVEECDPAKIYLEHGKIEKFFYYIMHYHENREIFSLNSN